MILVGGTQQTGAHVCVSFSDGYRQYLHVELSEVVVENPTGQTAEAQVWAETGRTGVQGARVDTRVLNVCHPHLNRRNTVRTHKHSRVKSSRLLYERRKYHELTIGHLNLSTFWRTKKKKSLPNKSGFHDGDTPHLLNLPLDAADQHTLQVVLSSQVRYFEVLTLV